MKKLILVLLSMVMAVTVCAESRDERSLEEVALAHATAIECKNSGFNKDIFAKLEQASMEGIKKYMHLDSFSIIASNSHKKISNSWSELTDGERAESCNKMLESSKATNTDDTKTNISDINFFSGSVDSIMLADTSVLLEQTPILTVEKILTDKEGTKFQRTVDIMAGVGKSKKSQVFITDKKEGIYWGKSVEKRTEVAKKLLTDFIKKYGEPIESKTISNNKKQYSFKKKNSYEPMLELQYKRSKVGNDIWIGLDYTKLYIKS